MTDRYDTKHDKKSRDVTGRIRYVLKGGTMYMMNDTDQSLPVRY